MSSESWNSLPEAARRAVESQLEPQESVAASFLFDLDESLRFAEGLVALTSRRLLIVRAAETTRTPPPAAGNSWANCQVAAWPIAAIASLVTHDRGGLGQFEVLGHDARLAQLHYTVGQAGKVRELIEAFEVARRAAAPLAEGIAPDPDVEIPETEEQPAASVGSLLRLSRFARKRLGMMLVGMLLTLAATATGLVAPYMTKPLVDDILTPYEKRVDDVQNLVDKGTIDETEAEARKQKIRDEWRGSFSKVPWYLSFMAIFALATWLLSWVQGWVLARLSERISADLRNATYEHLHRLSLDFFSAKRTGDLVARISSDTDRICNFLADSLADFVTDAMMIVGTVGVLFSLDPLLALATMGTFPIIGWMTFRIR
ncbi:MAG TPA: ABC transporter transmembrane domain-containing protein, partial [Planctomycetaceae bacterium]